MCLGFGCGSTEEGLLALAVGPVLNKAEMST